MSNRTVQVPQIPALPANLDPAVRKWCEAVENILRIREGLLSKGTNSRFTKIDDLVKAGVVADGVIK